MASDAEFDSVAVQEAVDTLFEAVLQDPDLTGPMADLLAEAYKRGVEDMAGSDGERPANPYCRGTDGQDG